MSEGKGTVSLPGLRAVKLVLHVASLAAALFNTGDSRREGDGGGGWSMHTPLALGSGVGAFPSNSDFAESAPGRTCCTPADLLCGTGGHGRGGVITPLPDTRGGDFGIVPEGLWGLRMCM